jgi:3-hydroxyisobutyrate dehydrogenase-like beta-hydroxyacid dehydrogenase
VRIGFVGLGAMGLPIARRLAAAGHQLVVFDVESSRLEAAAELGLTAASAGAAAAGVDAIFTVLPADAHVEAVTTEILASGNRPPLYVDLSTIAPETIDAISVRMRRAGIEPVSVSIARGTAAAARGQLALYVGSEQPISPELTAALGAIATDVRFVSGLSAAKAVKLANNMILACLVVAICEGLVLGQRVGRSSAETVLDLAENGCESWALRHHIADNVLKDDLGPEHFSLANMIKDMRLYCDFVGQQRRQANLAHAALASYEGAATLGLGRCYHPIVIRWIEQCAGDQPSIASTEADRGVGSAIGGGVAAVQLLAAIEALSAVQTSGIGIVEAAGHLAAGSAANESLDAAVAHLEEGGDLDGYALPAKLDRALELAAGAGTPALMAAAARQELRSNATTTVQPGLS